MPLEGTRVAHRAESFRQPLALIASAEEWLARALESVLARRNMVVSRVASGRGALDSVRDTSPDLILLDYSLRDLDSVRLCLQLREQNLVTPSTPVIVLSALPVTKEQRAAALRAGAWDVLSFPLDAEELALRFETYVGGKLDADRAWRASLVERTTGLYNAQGLERRAGELTAEARRRRAALACVAVSVEPTSDAAADGNVVGQIALVLRSKSRLSDAVGCWDGREFAVLAPGTDPPGAVTFARRLVEALEAGAGQVASRLDVRAGYEAAADSQATPVAPQALLEHARSALARSRAEPPGGDHIRRYRDGPP